MKDEQREEVRAAWTALQDAWMKLDNLGEIEEPDLAETIEEAMNHINNAMATLWNI